MSQPTTTAPRFCSPFRTAKRRFTKGTLLGRPLRRKDSGTDATNVAGRRKAKRVRLRKLQRQARRRP
jgi:predicted amidophosphoribosyltransferase